MLWRVVFFGFRGVFRVCVPVCSARFYVFFFSMSYIVRMAIHFFIILSINSAVFFNIKYLFLNLVGNHFM